MAAWADGIDLINHFGTITISNAGITSKGSQLIQFNGVNAGALARFAFVFDRRSAQAAAFRRGHFFQRKDPRSASWEKGMAANPKE